MIKVRDIFNYPLWLFRPRAILDASRLNPIIDVPAWERVLFVGDPELIKKINKQTGKTFLGGKGNAFLGPLLGKQSVFLLEGEQHKLARTLIMKAIGPDKIDKKQKKIQSMIDSFVNELNAKKSAEILKENRWLTFQIIMLFVFPEIDRKLKNKLFNYIEKTTGILANVISYNKTFWYPSGRISVGHIVNKMVGDVDNIIFQIIDNHKTNEVTGEESNLLDILVKEKKTYQYNNRFIRDNLVSVIAAGYDTTGSALSWLCFWLSKTSKQDLSELQGELKSGSGSEAPLANAFVNESLRYCSPIEILPRKINFKEIDNVYELIGPDLAAKLIKKDGLVSPCPYAVHHNPDVYKNPEDFNFKRFVDSNYKPHEFLPFGGGNRYCLGYILGTKILNMYLLTFLKQNKTLKLVHNLKFKPVRRNVSLWPAYRMKTTIKEI